MSNDIMPGLFVRNVDSLLVITGARASKPEIKAAEILGNRIQARSGATARVVKEGGRNLAPENGITALVGVPGNHGILGKLVGYLKIDLPGLPDTEEIHPEGFALRTKTVDGTRYVVVAGSDGRGTIYGVGELLRRLTFHEGSIDIPHIDFSDRPALPMRGTVAVSVGPNLDATRVADLRPQTDEERLWGVEDMMLVGANILRTMEDVAREYGLMVSRGSLANAMPGDFPEEWKATPSNSLHIKVFSYFPKRFACPSIPEVRERLLEEFETVFRENPGCEYFTVKSGDVAGCTCERCMPWGRTFIRLLHEIGDLLHKYHPETKLLGTSQNITVEGDQAILDYLNDNNTGWLYAYNYAPGGNQMTTYNRPPLNPRWFEYEGFGRWGNYIRHIHHNLPSKTELVLTSDISHWIRSQYGVDQPDMALAVVYQRRAFNARPRAYHEVANDVLHYAIGDITYSEGIHDDFNKWFWFRKLWNPRLSAGEITREYCRYWFGPEAEEEMTEAIYTMEDNLGRPVLGNEGMSGALELLRSAGEKIPENLMERDFRWRMMIQKALLDRYIQLRLERGVELKDRAGKLLETAGRGHDVENNLRMALGVLSEPEQTEEMVRIKDEVLAIGEESHEIIGYREPAYYTVDEYDLAEIGWWKREIERALASSSLEDMENRAIMISRYEDPGEGGYFERIGWPYDRIHLRERENILGYFPFTGPARVSEFSMGYSWQKEDAMMMLVYEDLDPGCEYVIRLSTGFHCEPLEENFDYDPVQVLVVNGVVISDEVPHPIGKTALSEYVVPGEVNTDGRLEIELKTDYDFPVVGLSAIWVMKRENMPWQLGAE